MITAFAFQDAGQALDRLEDDRREAVAWLKEWGNPYSIVAVDQSGRVGINYGV